MRLYECHKLEVTVRCDTIVGLRDYGKEGLGRGYQFKNRWEKRRNGMDGE